MNHTFTIKDLSQLSRIKPHTLRIWEQRYGILKPNRSESNIRQYSQEELKYLLNISILYENGLKISNIAKLSQTELTDEVKKLAACEMQYPSHVQGLVVAMLELDEDRFNRQLTNNILSVGMEETITQIIYPFLKHIGVLWQTNTINPAQEHFITNLIRQKLIVAIDGISDQRLRPDHKKIILFLPEGELHEISLLFANYMVKLLGHKSVYLGQSLPLTDLAEIQSVQKADVVFTIITSTPCLEDVGPYLFRLKEAVGEASTVWVTGYQVLSQEIELPNNLVVIKDTDEMRKLLSE
jgi:DNA-binding transcriptional MerR regulator